MASSTSRAPEPWIPDLPDNELAVEDTFRAYRDSLRRMSIPELMAQSVAIAEAQQRLASSSLASVISPETRISEYLSAVDRTVQRSRPTGSPSAGSERGRAAEASRTSPQPRPSPDQSRWGVARKIAALQARVEMRERGIE